MWVKISEERTLFYQNILCYFRKDFSNSKPRLKNYELYSHDPDILTLRNPKPTRNLITISGYNHGFLKRKPDLTRDTKCF